MANRKNVVEWLERYYIKCCDGDWEHSYGVKINSVMNQGWSVKIDLEDTTLEDIDFNQIEIERNDSNWIKCRIENKVFIGEGGGRNLEEIIRIFAKWSDLNSKHDCGISRAIVDTQGL